MTSPLAQSLSVPTAGPSNKRPMPSSVAKVIGSKNHTRLRGYGDLFEKEIECTICFNRMLGRILSLCSEGHCACEPCFESLLKPKKCPVCRELLVSPSRNRTLENIISKYVFSCGNAQCHVSDLEPWALLEHQRNCNFRFIRCPVLGCGYSVRAE